MGNRLQSFFRPSQEVRGVCLSLSLSQPVSALPVFPSGFGKESIDPPSSGSVLCLSRGGAFMFESYSYFARRVKRLGDASISCRVTACGESGGSDCAERCALLDVLRRITEICRRFR